MIIDFRIRNVVPTAFALVLSCTATSRSATMEISENSYSRHWLANTGGTLNNHVQNFLTDMTLYWWEQSPRSNPLLLTASFWDEGHCSYCAYDTRNGGVPLGKAEWWKDTIRSDRAYDYVKATPSSEPVLRNKCQIVNFWGRGFMGNLEPPPADSLPFVACTNGDTIQASTVEDPSAIAFDMKGNLLVADNGPDQDIKIFAPGRPDQPVRTFGDKGGVFARSTNGQSTWISGQAGIRRFWGIRGLAVDSQGTVYVGNTGMPMQTMGGTDIRAFKVQRNALTGFDDTTLAWQQQGLAFVNVADADPASNGTDVYTSAKRFRMDYAEAPGKSWSLASVTLDPFKYPKDPRLSTPMETQWMRRIGGKRVQFNTNMYGEFVYVARFTDTSDIAIPTAFICNYGSPAAVAWADTLPTWERNETNKKTRWYWIDRNGDGTPQSSEFGTWETWGMFNQGIDVDEKGNIWFGGRGEPSTTFNEGGITMIPVKGLLANGVPNIRIDSAVRLTAPFQENYGYVPRMKYVASKDRMYLATAQNAWYSNRIYVYDNYLKARPKAARCSIDLGYDSKGESEIHLDQGTDVMTLPFSFTADSEYVYVGYLDNGRYSRRRGEVTIYESKTCQPVGWMAPGKDMDYFAGTIDIVNGLNVAVLTNGDRVVFEEEDGAGKVLAFHWAPPSKGPADLAPRSVGAQPRVRWNGRHLGIEGIAGTGLTWARWFDLGGREIGSAPIPTGSDNVQLSLEGGRRWIQSVVELSGPGQKVSLKVPAPY